MINENELEYRIEILSDELNAKDNLINTLQDYIEILKDQYEIVEEYTSSLQEERNIIVEFLGTHGFSNEDIEEYKTQRKL